MPATQAGGTRMIGKLTVCASQSQYSVRFHLLRTAISLIVSCSIPQVGVIPVGSPHIQPGIAIKEAYATLS